MDKRRVLLLCIQSLLGESLETILNQAENVELIGPWNLDDQVLARLSRDVPDVVLVAESEGKSESVASLTTQILDSYPDVPVIRVALAQDTIRVYTSHAVPARTADLIGTIRNLTSGQHKDGESGQALQ